MTDAGASTAGRVDTIAAIVRRFPTRAQQEAFLLAVQAALRGVAGISVAMPFGPERREFLTNMAEALPADRVVWATLDPGVLSRSDLMRMLGATLDQCSRQAHVLLAVDGAETLPAATLTQIDALAGSLLRGETRTQLLVAAEPAFLGRLATDGHGRLAAYLGAGLTLSALAQADSGLAVDDMTEIQPGSLLGSDPSSTLARPGAPAAVPRGPVMAAVVTLAAAVVLIAVLIGRSAPPGQTLATPVAANSGQTAATPQLQIATRPPPPAQQSATTHAAAVIPSVPPPQVAPPAAAAPANLLSDPDGQVAANEALPPSLRFHLEMPFQFNLPEAVPFDFPAMAPAEAPHRPVLPGAVVDRPKGGDRAETPPSEATAAAGPGLLLIARRGDTLGALYRRVYAGVVPPPYAAVIAANPDPVHQGARLLFPTPPNGWPSPVRAGGR